MLKDTDPMPFGKYKGEPMQDVPVEYLHWFWHNGTVTHEPAKLVKEYIKEQLNALKLENKDLIWS